MNTIEGKTTDTHTHPHNRFEAQKLNVKSDGEIHDVDVAGSRSFWLWIRCKHKTQWKAKTCKENSQNCFICREKAEKKMKKKGRKLDLLGVCVSSSFHLVSVVFDEINLTNDSPRTKSKTIKLSKKHKLFGIEWKASWDAKRTTAHACPDLYVSYRQCTWLFLGALLRSFFSFCFFFLFSCAVCSVARFYLVRSLISLSNVSFPATECAQNFLFFHLLDGTKPWVRAWNVIRYLLWKPLTRKVF